MSDEVEVFSLVGSLSDDEVRELIHDIHGAEVDTKTNRELVERWLLILMRRIGLGLVVESDNGDAPP